MAKKQEIQSMVESLAEFKMTKNIDSATLIGVLEESFRSVIAKHFGTDENFSVVVNPNNGDLEIYQSLEVVADGEVVDPAKQIALSQLPEDDNDFEIGEEYVKSIDFSRDLGGRRNILTLRQTLQSKVLELEHENVYNHFVARKGQLVSAKVYQIWKSEVLLIDDEEHELHLRKEHQIPSDFYKKGETVRCVIYDVDYRNNNPKIYVSRTHEDFLRRLLENEVPEIQDGIITIQNVARIPGERAKITVETDDERIDPVGACVGQQGSRIRSIVRELRNENIDVIPHTSNKLLLMQRALSPAQITRVDFDEERHLANVFMPADQVAVAIGKGGMNIKLAAKLTGYEIDVYRDGMEAQVVDDIRLDEFADEIDQWVIDAIKGIGFETARAVLGAPRQMLVDKADLEEEQVDDIIRILKAEFDEE
ncbi:MAG: transcription termination factor NusA [Bacteroidales bacterium]|nr:transcription termination factor NusA [Bacteroidales bacterium]